MDMHEQLNEATDLLDMTFANVRNGDHLAALRTLDGTLKRLQEVAIVCVQKAYDAGATKKAIAEALDVPPSVFRGMQRRAA
jgi:hypothetical protein